VKFIFFWCPTYQSKTLKQNKTSTPSHPKNHLVQGKIINYRFPRDRRAHIVYSHIEQCTKDTISFYNIILKMFTILSKILNYVSYSNEHSIWSLNLKIYKNIRSFNNIIITFVIRLFIIKKIKHLPLLIYPI